MAVDDVDVARGMAVSGAVRVAEAGSCRSGRRPGSPSTATYAPTVAHAGRHAALWLGDRGRTFSYSALQRSLAYARVAGIERFHPHMLGTAATRWLAAGGLRAA